MNTYDDALQKELEKKNNDLIEKNNELEETKKNIMNGLTLEQEKNFMSKRVELQDINFNIKGKILFLESECEKHDEEKLKKIAS